MPELYASSGLVEPELCVPSAEREQENQRAVLATVRFYFPGLCFREQLPKKNALKQIRRNIGRLDSRNGGGCRFFSHGRKIGLMAFAQEIKEEESGHHHRGNAIHIGGTGSVPPESADAAFLLLFQAGLTVPPAPAVAAFPGSRSGVRRNHGRSADLHSY